MTDGLMSLTYENRPDTTASEWQEVARLVPVLCGMARSGHSVLIKIDGYRDASSRYTVVVNGGVDEHPLFRCDASSLPALLAEAVHACGLSDATVGEAGVASELADALRLADASVHDASFLAVYAEQSSHRPYFNLVYGESSGRKPSGPTLCVDGDDLVSMLQGTRAKRSLPQVS